MTKSFWRASDEQRHTILLMEALGLIHDLGKMSDRLLESRDSESSSTVQYGYNLLSDPRTIDIYNHCTNIPGNPSAEFVQEILNTATNEACAFGERTDINELLKKIELTWISEQYNFAELMPLLTKTKLSVNQEANWHNVVAKSMEPGRLVGYLHGIAHIEKEGDPDYQQPYSRVFRATPFGHEEQVCTNNLKNLNNLGFNLLTLLPLNWLICIHELTTTFQILPLDDIEKITTDRRSEWLEQMKVLMKRGLADNRRPHNEISLWDWGYTVATLTKAAANYIFKNGWSSNIRELPFCTLRINLDILERYTRSDKISDLLGVKQVLDDAFQSVQTLLEESYALGNQLYRDETGFYYLLPDIFDTTEQKALREEIQAFFSSDFCPQVHFSNPVKADDLHHVKSSDGDEDTPQSLSRKLVAEPRTEALKEKPVRTDNNLYLFETEWKDGRPENAEICTVCGMRPIGYPHKGSQPEVEQKLPCWAKQQKAKERKICRICLERRGRRSEIWAKGNLQDTIWTDEVADEKGRLALFVGKLGLEGWLDGTLLSTIQVTRNTAKNPSPARLYRIAEIARAFWEKVTDELMPIIVGQRSFRLEVCPDADNFSDLGDYHAYDLDVDGVVLSVVWDNPHQRFLTTDNLSYFAKQSSSSSDDLIRELKTILEGKKLQILEPSSFLKSSSKRAEITIREVKEAGNYLPAIPILTEPSLCLMLIPADKALELAHKVKKEYEQQMGRVRDRLPLNLGLIFCNRRTPIRTVLEAGRAMLNISGKFDMDSGKGWEDWRLMEKENSGGLCKLEFDNGITWDTPVITGDRGQKDEWYPRLYQGISWEQGFGRKPEPKHICDLKPRTSQTPKDKGHKVWVRPSHFDFEYLDTTARRFEIHYDENGRRPRRTRPFYLEDLVRFDTLWKILKNLKNSQRNQVIYTIEATREMWHGQDLQKSWTDTIFKQFVTDTLANATWTKDYKKWTDIPQKQRQQLIDAGVRGELADLAELHMEILKER